MKKKDKTAKKVKQNKKLHYSFDYIKMTLQQGDKHRTMWVQGSEAYKWTQKYRSCRRRAKCAALAMGVLCGFMDAKKLKEAISQNEKMVVWETIMDDMTTGLLLFYLIMTIFINKSTSKMNAAMKKKLSEY
ncbi:MAG: hypothetical protein K2O71_01530 [Lachnospiraceae bacterium]|nr:hypothetical protein [Lachnospiraceae bacterium]